MMIIAEFAFYLFMEVLMYTLGRIAIPILSLGRARAVRTREIFSRKPVAPYDDDGKMLVPEWAATVLGVMLLTVGIAAYMARR